MKIIGVGRNYADHAKELGNAVPSEPLIFFKPDTALLKNNQDFYYPDFTNDIHYECELVVRISREGKYIKQKFAHTYIDGIGLGIDFTARDIQSKAKENGHPWTLAKGFNHSAPVSKFHSPERYPDLSQVSFSLHINNELKQEGNTKNMIFDIPFLIEYISRYIVLKKGDMIFTGTPEGVGPVHRGDLLTGRLEGEKMFEFFVK